MRPIRTNRTLRLSSSLTVLDPIKLLKKVNKLNFGSGDIFAVEAFESGVPRGDHAVYIKKGLPNTAFILDQNSDPTLVLHIIDYFATQGFTLTYLIYDGYIPPECFTNYGCNRFATMLKDLKY